MATKDRKRVHRILEFEKVAESYQARNFSKTMEYLKYYCEKYPEDDFGKLYQSKILRQSELFQDALDILNGLDRTKNFMINMDIIKCYIGLEKYEDALNLIEKIRFLSKKDIVTKFLERAKVYCMIQLNKSYLLNPEKLDYEEKQMLEYSEEKALNYMRNYPFEVPLNSNIDLEELLETVKKALINSKYLVNTSTLTDTYLFDYPDVGESESGKVNVLKVVTTHKTQDIILLYPCIHMDKYPANMINQNLLMTPKVKGKRLSQIEKFQRRYEKTTKQ